MEETEIKKGGDDIETRRERTKRTNTTGGRRMRRMEHGSPLCMVLRKRDFLSSLWASEVAPDNWPSKKIFRHMDETTALHGSVSNEEPSGKPLTSEALAAASCRHI